jgi:hypothetical protein
MVTFFYSKYTETREEFLNVLPVCVMVDVLLCYASTVLTFIILDNVGF